MKEKYFGICKKDSNFFHLNILTRCRIRCKIIYSKILFFFKQFCNKNLLTQV